MRTSIGLGSAGEPRASASGADPRGEGRPEQVSQVVRGGPLAGVLEALGIPLLFVLGGTLGYALLLGSFYPRAMADAPEVPGQLWLVDGYNALSVGLLGGEERSQWWRADCRERLLEHSARFREPGTEVWVIFDGGDPSGGRTSAEDHPKTVFAPDADAWLAARVRGSPHPQRITVVTADRRLAGRVLSAGAAVVSPGDFLLRCEV